MKYPDEKRMWKIYALVDPLDCNVRYIGMSKNAKRRLRQHLHMLDKNERKNAWIDNLRGWGLVPELRIIETIDNLTLAKEREQYWIRHYSQGGLLTNLPNAIERRRERAEA